VHPHNLSETWQKIQNGTLSFRAFLDRASDNVEAVQILVQHLKAKGTPVINDPDLLPGANDKATMHLELLAKGVNVPYTIIMGPHEGNHIQDVPGLQHIGIPFIIKPANGGGGRGVILGAQDKVDVVRARKALWGDKILLQEEIQPAQFPVGMAWFRTFMVNHCRLTLFSTEIALSRDGPFVAVDYVNDQPDLRPQSKARDGVPDQVLNNIVKDIIHWVKQYVRGI